MQAETSNAKTGSETSVLDRCLAELILEARRYQGGYITYGDRVRGEYGPSEYGGKTDDGRYSFTFWHESDAFEFKDDAMAVSATYGIDAELTIHPFSSGRHVVLVRLGDAEAES